MVGVPTSNRCDNCRKRKKKCDERRPSCSECIRGGWTCPGYKPKWKFIDEAPRLLEHYSNRKFIFEEISISSEEDSSERADVDIRRYGRAVVATNSLRSSYCNSFNILTKPSVPRNPTSDQLQSALVYCLDSKVQGVLIPLRFIGSFFEFIPARLGRSAALDHAVSCLCAIYQSTSSIPYHLNKTICQTYVKALSALRSCIGDEALQTEPETLCASILLQMCELNVNVDRGQWGQLSHGTAILLQFRGVHRYRNPFDYAMLESQLSFVLRQSMKSKEHCFLRSPDWYDLLLQGPPRPFNTLQSPGLTLRLRLHFLMVDLPSFIIDCSEIAGTWTSQNGWEARLDSLIRKASTKFDDMREWLANEAEPVFLGRSPQETVETYVHYPDMLCAVVDAVANTVLLILDKSFCFLSQITLQSSSQARTSTRQRFEKKQLLSDSENAERRQRVTMAFDFVQGECPLAAKPLLFGLQAIQSSLSSCLIEARR